MSDRDQITRISVCRCGKPLVPTFHWAHYELYCLDCGAHYGMFGPASVNATPKRLADLEARKAEWAEHANDLITPQSWRRDCDRCTNEWGGLNHDTTHAQHATPEERQAHDAATAWIAERILPRYRRPVPA